MLNSNSLKKVYISPGLISRLEEWPTTKELQHQRKTAADLKKKLNKTNVLRTILGETKIVLKLVYNWDGRNDKVSKNLHSGFASVLSDMVSFSLRERNSSSLSSIGQYQFKAKEI